MRCLFSVSHYSPLTFVWGDAWPQHSQLDSVLPAVVMAAEELSQWTWEVSIVIIIIIIMNIFLDTCRGHRVQLHPGMSVLIKSLVTPVHWSGSTARGGDVLQTEA